MTKIARFGALALALFMLLASSIPLMLQGHVVTGSLFFLPEGIAVNLSSKLQTALSSTRLAPLSEAASQQAGALRAVELAPGDGQRWHAYSITLLESGHTGAALTRSVEMIFRTSPWAKDVRLSQALMSVRAINWVEPELRKLWLDNLDGITRYQKSEFLINAARLQLDFQACALLAPQIPFWCEHIEEWRHHCAQADLIPKWQRFCSRSGIS